MIETMIKEQLYYLMDVGEYSARIRGAALTSLFLGMILGALLHL
jgi:hypothetical protein